jgi:hypothetical protein
MAEASRLIAATARRCVGLIELVKTYGPNNLAIYAYGSLLSDPGEKIAPHIVARVPQSSPWPIEYARRARLRGDGPTLVLHKSGAVVRGQLLVLDIEWSKAGLRN